MDDDPYFYYYPKFGIFKQEVMNFGLDAVLKSSLVLVLNEYMEKERDDYFQANAYERTLP
jgi:putative transposase